MLCGISPQSVKERALTPSHPCYTTLLVKGDNLKHWCLDQERWGTRGRSMQDSSFMYEKKKKTAVPESTPCHIYLKRKLPYFQVSQIHFHKNEQ